MQIIHDHSYISQRERELKSHGYACESIYSLRFSFVFTEAQKAENRAYADKVGLQSDAWDAHITASARKRSQHMERAADAMAQNFKIFQYGSEDEVPYSSDWDLFFWCNDAGPPGRQGLQLLYAVLQQQAQPGTAAGDP